MCFERTGKIWSNLKKCKVAVCVHLIRVEVRPRSRRLVDPVPLPSPSASAVKKKSTARLASSPFSPSKEHSETEKGFVRVVVLSRGKASGLQVGGVR